MRARYLVAIGLLAGCGPNTKLVNTWADPSVGQLQFRRVLTVCACKNAGLRRTVEDRLASDIRGSQPSYALLPDRRLDDRRAARAAIQSGGYDGVVMMRLVSVDRTSTYVPGQAYIVPVGYRRLWDNWGFAYSPYGVVYDPGYVRQDEVVNFDTNVYSVTDEKLVWASRSRTEDPRSVRKVVDDVVSETVKAMKKQNLVLE